MQNKFDCFASLKDVGILPVVCLKSDSELETFATAISKTPLRCVELTMRHPYATTAIAELKRRCPELTVGAGTVTTLQKLDEAIEAGADYGVSPVIDAEILDAADERGFPFLAGCATPSEIFSVYKRGCPTVKLFPAELMGGAKALKLYESALSGITFVPTGGINMDNLGDYLACKNVLACGGSFMAPAAMISAGDVGAIVSLIEKCIEIYKGSRI